MERGKIIVIEGTDCSGKETQSNLLLTKLRKENIKVERFSFPVYDSPTGRITGGPILGKEQIGNGYFEEGSSKLDPKVFSLYMAADRKYNINKINDCLDKGINVILDRYVYSNMAFQGAKFNNDIEKLEFFKWIEQLEFELLELPKGDINVFLHLPTSKVIELLDKRSEQADQNEKDHDYLKKTEETYILLANKYDFKIIECVQDEEIKTIEDINNELYNYIFKKLK